MSLRSRDRGGSHTSPNLTPLLDVVLQLITFFMMLIHFGTKLEGATKAVRLPVTPAALPGADLALDRLTVALDARGRLLANGEARKGKAAQAWWAEQAKQPPRGAGDARRAGRGAVDGGHPPHRQGMPRTARVPRTWPRHRSGASPISAWSSCGVASDDRAPEHAPPAVAPAGGHRKGSCSRSRRCSTWRSSCSPSSS